MLNTTFYYLMFSRVSYAVKLFKNTSANYKIVGFVLHSVYSLTLLRYFSNADHASLDFIITEQRFSYTHFSNIFFFFSNQINLQLTQIKQCNDKMLLQTNKFKKKSLIKPIKNINMLQQLQRTIQFQWKTMNLSVTTNRKLYIFINLLLVTIQLNIFICLQIINFVYYYFFYYQNYFCYLSPLQSIR